MTDIPQRVQREHEGVAELVAEVRRATEAYEGKIASGEIRFDSSGYAVHEDDPSNGWIANAVREHIALMDESR